MYHFHYDQIFSIKSILKITRKLKTENTLVSGKKFRKWISALNHELIIYSRHKTPVKIMKFS